MSAGCDWYGLRALIDEVDNDAADTDAITGLEPVRIIDFELVHQHAVTAFQVTNIDAVWAGKNFSVPARDRDIGKHDLVVLLSPDDRTHTLFEQKNHWPVQYDGDKCGSVFRGISRTSSFSIKPRETCREYC